MVDMPKPFTRAATAGAFFGFREYPSVSLDIGAAVMSGTLRFMSRAEAAKRTNARKGGGVRRPGTAGHDGG